MPFTHLSFLHQVMLSYQTRLIRLLRGGSAFQPLPMNEGVEELRRDPTVQQYIDSNSIVLRYRDSVVENKTGKFACSVL